MKVLLADMHIVWLQWQLVSQGGLRGGKTVVACVTS